MSPAKRSSMPLKRTVTRASLSDRFINDHIGTSRSACSGKLGCRLGGLDLGGLIFDELAHVVDHLRVRPLMVGPAFHVNEPRPRAAAGKSDVGDERLARAIHDTADNGKGDGRGDMRKRRLEDD